MKVTEDNFFELLSESVNEAVEHANTLDGVWISKHWVPMTDQQKRQWELFKHFAKNHIIR